MKAKNKKKNRKPQNFNTLDIFLLSHSIKATYPQLKLYDKIKYKYCQ